MEAEEKDPRLWQRIDALLSEALALPEAEREQWLAGLSEDDRSLGPSLRAMLSRSLTTDGFMQAPVPAEALAAAAEAPSAEQAGAMVGPYRLLRPLGAGGMGQVWLAEREDGSIQRQVALKLPRTSWAPGMAARLKQERDALAALEHPNIARLYDAGMTATGRPYIAMEYVDGVPIDAHARGLTLRERLSLFLQVAGAVSYAHARLVVHRDLKPTNILVSASGSVRLLDFGAAKLLREEGPGDSELTREIGPALSPDYASPEQIRGERVTVAADVYSLGVVLFELLTGQRPYRLPRDSWGALVDAVSNLQPPLASTRVVGDRRAARALRGDLDAVVAKALRREVGERYASVQALADDVSRYLAGEPVLAKDQRAAERLWKFVSRHSLAVGTAAVVTLVVGAASGVALWQARVARAEARRAERVRAFIASILTSATPKTGVGGVVTASELLTAAAGRIDGELSAEPGVAAELGVIVAQSFDSLGELAKAEPVLRAAVPRAEATFGRSHPLTLRAKTVLADAVVLHDVPGALAIIEEVVPAAIRGLPATAEEAVSGLKEKAYVLAKLNRAEDSYAALRESIALAEKHFGPLDERTITGLGSLANTYGRFADFPNQVVVAADAVERARRAFGARRPHETLLMMERFYADALLSERPGDSVPIHRTVLADQQRLDAAETTRVRDAKLQLGYALLLSGRLEEGLPLVREAVALERQQNAAESDDRRGFSMALSLALLLAERTDEGLQEQERLAALVAPPGDRATSVRGPPAHSLGTPVLPGGTVGARAGARRRGGVDGRTPRGNDPRAGGADPGVRCADAAPSLRGARPARANRPRAPAGEDARRGSRRTFRQSSARFDWSSGISRRRRRSSPGAVRCSPGPRSRSPSRSRPVSSGPHGSSFARVTPPSRGTTAAAARRLLGAGEPGRTGPGRGPALARPRRGGAREACPRPP